MSLSNAAPPSPPSEESITFDVTSETGPLQQVIVHTPGPELEHVLPDERLDLLFDDILFVEEASKEHQLMCTLFRKLVGRSDAVLQVTTLFEETLQQEEARLDFVNQICRLSTVRNLQAFENDLKQLAPHELLRLTLTGDSPLPLNMPPLPNLIFTRDLAAVVDKHIVMSHAATAARARESILINVIFNYHPAFEAVRDHIVELPRGVTFEGGDLLVVSPEVVLIGHSERTSLSGIMAVARALFERTPVEHVLAVDLPKQRSCMHLDTVFTFATPTECVVYPPLVSDAQAGTVVHFTPGPTPEQFTSETRPRLAEALEDVLDRSLTFIPCGGNDALNQRREQWTDGANFFAVAPGVVVGYERNGYTFEAMREHGYRTVSARSFLSYYEESEFEPGEKIAIKLEGTELSRGRGGPRCMTLPLARKAIAE